MTSPITEVQIAGTSLDLGDVEYSISIQHGRNDVLSTPDASSAQIIIRGAAGVAAKMADPLTIEAYGFRRFTGEISDITITHESSTPPTAITTIIAMGNLAKLGLKLTGEGGYPHESVNDRADTILTNGGLPYLNGGSDTLEVHQNNDDDIKSCLAALQELAEWSGATFFDTPEGLIAFESYGARGLTAYAATWQALTEDWDYYAQTWDSFPTSFAAYTLPTSATIWTPTWTQNLTGLVNDITVIYGGPDSDTFEQAEDTASIATYGRRSYKLNTQLRQDDDAANRAGNILTAQANPLWQIGQISVIVDTLSNEDRDRVLALISGATVTLPDLPTPAPFFSFTGVVEGWGETYTPGQHILTLSISDPRYSYQTVAWEDIDATLEWGDVKPDVAWYNVVNADDLLAA